MSIRFLLADLGFIAIEIDFTFLKIKQIVICKLKIVLNIMCQFSAHTSKIVCLTCM